MQLLEVSWLRDQIVYCISMLSVEIVERLAGGRLYPVVRH